MSFRLCLIVGLLCPLLVTGCGGPNMARVQGRVICNGKAVKEAALTFNPMPRFDGDKEPGKPATGFTDEKGNYILSTHRAYDGALVGKHRVLVVLDDTNPARCPRQKELVLDVNAGSNEFEIDLSK